MKKDFLIIWLFVSVAFFANANANANANAQHRGLVAVPTSATSSSIMVSWRQFASDPLQVSYDLYRNGVCISKDMVITNYLDSKGSKTAKYQVIAKASANANANHLDTTEVVTPWSDIYKNIKLQCPAASTSFRYFPQEGATGDLNGDGKYEIVVKWSPTNQHDNADDGITGPVYLDAYTLDGEFMWRVELGRNIRAGSHYTQIMVYDFNGDGKAEMIVKTAPGTKDGTGAYVSDAADDETIKAINNKADYRNDSGRIMSGEELLTVFDGQTGKAIHTIWYNPNRGFGVGGSATYSSNWGDSYGNRGERYLACVAYLDGPDANPSAVMCRGYYTRSYLWAVDFDGKKLSTKWLHGSVSTMSVQHTDKDGVKTTKTYRSNTSGGNKSYTAYAQGNHNLSVADVDGDGCDEIIYGSATIDHDGYLLYTTGLGHGDAMHVGDLLPDHPGIEVFTVHESEPHGWDVHDGATGEILLRVTGDNDNGRGMAADIDTKNRGYEYWSANSYNVYNSQGKVLSTNRPTYCFRIYWDGDEYDELLDGGKIDKNTTRLFSPGNFGGSAVYGSKASPFLSADLLGDWREEVIYFSKEDSASLNIFTTTTASKYAVPTLMDDHTYRMGVAWENVAYNQPPHIGYYLPDSVMPKFHTIEGSKQQTITLGDSLRTTTCYIKNANSAMLYYVYLDGEKIKSFKAPDSCSFVVDKTTHTFTFAGCPTKAGRYQLVVRAVTPFNGQVFNDTLVVNVQEPPTILRGDANGDSTVDVTDITAIASYILGTHPEAWDEKNADANNDGNIDVSDITATASIILGN